MKPVIPVNQPEDSDLIGEGAEAIRETRQALYDLFPIGPSDLDYSDTANFWPAGSLTGGQEPGLDPENPPTSDTFQDRAFLVGDSVLQYDYTIPYGKNAISPGPLDTGTSTVTVPLGSTWTNVGTEDLEVQYLRDLADVEAGGSVTDQDALLWQADAGLWIPGPAPAGPPGPPGPGFDFLGTVTTSTALPGWPNSYTGSDGDTYVTDDLNHIWSWNGNEWTDTGPMGTKGDKGDKGDQGDKGDKGDDGISATVDVGSTTTGLAGTNASVTNSGSTSAAVFNFTVPKGDKGDPGDPATGVQLGNTATWTHGQYNQLHIPSKTGSGLSSRFTWDAEEYPVASLSDGVEPLFMCAPDSPSVNGMFIAITWLSLVGDQVWTLDEDKFGTDVVAPENLGEDVTRIFWSKFGKWYDV
jgi:hypothetical protein